MLSDLQQRFVEEYLVDMNASAAAARAGYSAQTAYSQGHRLLKYAEVSEAIEAGRKARGERTEITADRVLKELARVAFADLKLVASWDPDAGLRYVPSSDLDDDASASISEITDKTTTSSSKDGQIISEKREQKVKLHDKMRALEMLGRHLGMFKADEAADQSQVLLKVLEVLANGGVSMDHIVAHLSAVKKPA